MSESELNQIISRLKLEAKKKDDEAIIRPQNEAWLHGVAEGLKEAGDIVVFFRNRAITNKEPNTEISGSLRSNQPSTTRESLSSSLDRASKNVQSWPQWKQQAAGADLYSSTKDEYNKWDVKNRPDVGYTKLLSLKIRNLIAEREFNTAQANRELAVGIEWLSDHADRDAVLASQIEELFQQANNTITNKARP